LIQGSFENSFGSFIWFDYSDSDWAGGLDDRHSTTRNVFLMAGGPISWKQAVVAQSTSEADYVT